MRQSTHALPQGSIGASEVGYVTRQEEGTGMTALHYACRQGEGMALAVLSLIDAGADAGAVRPRQRSGGGASC